ncbi:hypothetical protein [Hydrogenophaga sp.]|uniref:hypothetical protein n=1 Tax=Hydrogenophaga sp. TaxID=1904254 RepID=UPI003F701EAB
MTPTPKDPVDALMTLVIDYGIKSAEYARASTGTFKLMCGKDAAYAAVESSARALAAVPAAEVQESVRWKQLVHMVERGVEPEILVDWINHPDRLDYAAKLRAEHG